MFQRDERRRNRQCGVKEGECENGWISSRGRRLSGEGFRV